MMITNYHLKISSIALIKLILSNDSRLSFNIEIEKIVQKNQTKRITRSNGNYFPFSFSYIFLNSTKNN